MRSNRYAHESKQNENENGTAEEAKRFIGRFQLFGYENQQKWCFFRCSVYAVCCGAVSRIIHRTRWLAWAQCFFTAAAADDDVVCGFFLSFVKLGVLWGKHCASLYQEASTGSKQQQQS